MTMKGRLQADHMAKSMSVLRLIGLPDLTVVTHGTIEEELKKVDLPDNTAASGGDTNSMELEFTIPMHHTREVAALELWWVECKGPVSPTYKKAGVITFTSISGNVSREYTLDGCFLTKRSLPEGDINNDGEMQSITFMMSIDNIFPIG